MSESNSRVVYVDEQIHRAAVEYLQARHEVILGFGPEAVDFADISSRIEGILIRTGRVTAEMISSAPKLQVIARHGVGTDAIDVHAAQRQGVQVLITPEANAISVAEHTIGLLLAAARRYSAADSAVRGGSFGSRDELVGVELAGKTLAVAGFGRIGARVAHIAEVIGMHVRIYDPFLPIDLRPENFEFVTELDSLLAGADAVTLHLPLTDASRQMIAGSQLDLLNPGALIVNTARGGLIDEKALADRLTGGHLGGAGIDVFSSEPEPPAGSPLMSAPSTILTPHTGAHTSASMYKMALHAAEGISAVLGRELLPKSVTPVSSKAESPMVSTPLTEPERNN